MQQLTWEGIITCISTVVLQMKNDEMKPKVSDERNCKRKKENQPTDFKILQRNKSSCQGGGIFSRRHASPFSSFHATYLSCRLFSANTGNSFNEVCDILTKSSGKGCPLSHFSLWIVWYTRSDWGIWRALHLLSTL